MSKYQQILNLFVAKDDVRPQFKQPFCYEDRAVATDAYTMVFFDKGKVEDLEPYDGAIRVFDCVPIENTRLKITKDELNAALASSPKVDEVRIEERKTECEACEGSGQVNFEFDYNLKTYELEGECPLCEGYCEILAEVRVPTGGKVPDYEKSFRLRGKTYRSAYFKRIIDVVNMTGADYIDMLNINDKPYSATLFEVSDVKILITSNHSEPWSDKNEVVYEIKAHP